MAFPLWASWAPTSLRTTWNSRIPGFVSTFARATQNLSRGKAAPLPTSCLNAQRPTKSMVAGVPKHDPSPFAVRSTPRYERLSDKLFKTHREFAAAEQTAVTICSTDPYNRTRRYQIKKLEGVPVGAGPYRLCLGRWRFRYDISGQAIELHYCGLRREDTYLRNSWRLAHTRRDGFRHGGIHSRVSFHCKLQTGQEVCPTGMRIATPASSA